MNKFIITESSGNIKLLARHALDGQWKKATLAVIIYMACIMVPMLILEFLFGSLNPENLQAMMYDTAAADEIYAGSVIGSFYSFLVTGAFTFGMTFYFIQLIRSRINDFGNVFSGFGYFFKTLGLYFMVSLFTFLWMLLLIVPGFIAAFRYSQAFYILADDPEKGIMQCIRESKELMKGNKGKLFCLQLSFIPWLLLAYFAFLIIAGIGFVIYMVTAAGVDVIGLVLVVIGLLLFILAVCVIEVYMMGANVIFYEMVTGRLRAAGSIPPNITGSVPPTQAGTFDPWQEY